MIECVFPTPVGRYVFERHFSHNELEVINSQEKKNNRGNFISVNKSILDLPELKVIKESLEKYLKDFLETVYSPKNETKIYITQSWINWTETGQFHHKHAHPNSFISGVLYIQADKSNDKIMFYRDEYRQLEIVPKEYHILNSDSWFFNVGTQDIILFPSGLTHSVQNTVSLDTRISLSFNTFLEGEIGNIEGPTLLTFKK
jgi:uncharacterized protein (TIGR02466 family)